jgi:hypothetical protein
MARGGQLGLAAPAPTPWLKYIGYVLAALFVIWILTKAFTPCPPQIVKKEGFESGCPCNKKKGGKGSAWVPFSS